MTTRKILSLALALIMVCSLVVVGVYADEAVEPVQLANLGKAPQIAGEVTGVPANATTVNYLSDLHNQDDAKALNDRVVDQLNNKIMLNQNYNGDLLAFDGAGGRKQIKANLDANGERVLANGISYKPTDLAVGYNGTKYAKGLGVHPDASSNADRYIVYNVKGLGDHFYAIAGATGANVTHPDTAVSNRRVIFEVWGSKAEEYSADAAFVKLAFVDQIRAYVVGQFDLDITGYNYIKLVVKMNTEFQDDNQACAVAWADAAIYSLTEVTPEDPSEPSEIPSEPSETPSEPSETPTTPARNPLDYFSSTVKGLSDEAAATASEISLDSLIIGSYVYPASGSTDPRPVNVDAAFKGNPLKVGANSYTEGFGLHISPDNNHTYVLLDVSGVKGTRLNTLVGITGTIAGDAERGVVFNVYGSNSASEGFELLASSGTFKGAEVGEIDVYIGDYKYLKLEVAQPEGQNNHSGGAVAFINPVIYEGNPGTADTFSALPVALLVLSGIAVVAMVAKKKED